MVQSAEFKDPRRQIGTGTLPAPPTRAPHAGRGREVGGATDGVGPGVAPQPTLPPEEPGWQRGQSPGHNLCFPAYALWLS